MKSVFSALIHPKPVIIFLQKTHLNSKSSPAFKVKWLSLEYYAPDMFKSCGMKNLISKATRFQYNVLELILLGGLFSWKVH